MPDYLIFPWIPFFNANFIVSLQRAYSVTIKLALGKKNNQQPFAHSVELNIQKLNIKKEGLVTMKTSI